MSIWKQKSALIEKRTSPPKFFLVLLSNSPVFDFHTPRDLIFTYVYRPNPTSWTVYVNPGRPRMEVSLHAADAEVHRGTHSTGIRKGPLGADF